MKGGYICVDCMRLDWAVTSDTQTIHGIFATVKTVVDSGKPSVLYNTVYDSVSVGPMPAYVIQVASNTIVINAGALQALIKNDDSVTINET